MPKNKLKQKTANSRFLFDTSGVKYHSGFAQPLHPSSTCFLTAAVSYEDIQSYNISIINLIWARKQKQQVLDGCEGETPDPIDTRPRRVALTEIPCIIENKV